MKIVPDSIFVGDLPSKITDEELVNAFSQYGPIISLKLNRPRNNRSCPSARIQFKRPESATAAVQDTNDIVIRRMPLLVMP